MNSRHVQRQPTLSHRLGVQTQAFDGSRIDRLTEYRRVNLDHAGMTICRQIHTTMASSRIKPHRLLDAYAKPR